VGELVELAFERVGLEYRDFVQIDESLRRGTAQLTNLVGDASKARERLGWIPTVGFRELVHTLVDAELARLEEARADQARRSVERR
jgi:GDPmannose 4,6-dehydratase